MASTASSVAIAMEVIAAIGMLLCDRSQPLYSRATDLYYNTKLNAGVAIFQIFASQMLGYGMAGLCKYSCEFDCDGILTGCVVRTLLVYPT